MCNHQFSVTSGTIFASRKMSFVVLLAAIVISANASLCGCCTMPFQLRRFVARKGQPPGAAVSTVRSKECSDRAALDSPQGMLTYGTETLSVRDFVRTGLVLTVLAYALTLLFGATYWRWLGYV
jgi:Sodium:sulfate symporter transmembrane region